MKIPKIVCIVPAKERSTRIPGKNLKLLAGKPMIAHILDTVKAIADIDRVIVSTDSEEIKKVALAHGAEAPFIRPETLTKDDVTTREVLEHALNWLKEHEGYEADYVLLLYATSPLLKRERIQEAIDIVKAKGSDSVISGTLGTHFYWQENEGGGWKRLYPLEIVNSQWMKSVFVENGAIYLTKTKFIPKQYVADIADIVAMEENENIDIDYPEDFEKAERILREN